MLPPLSLYIHVPYCVQKCPYCDFHSTVQTNIPEAAYLATVKRELSFWRQKLREDERPLDSIFFGGGTPSLLQSTTIAQLLQQVKNLWPLHNQCEITLESNPESCTSSKIEQWLTHGVNRISLGIQAFNQERLSTLGRPHNIEEARQAIRLSRQGGFSNINLDLIFATPGQTIEGWQAELAEAMEWQPQHLSCYGLTIEEGTPFARLRRQGEFSPINEEDELAIFSTTGQTLATGGWNRYEISNFTQPGKACRHNLNYWQSADYIGVGPAAHGRLTQTNPETAKPSRYRTVNHTAGYMEKQAENGSSLLEESLCSTQEAGAECLIMGLRLEEGMNRETYRRLSGQDLVVQKAQEIKTCQGAGLITVTAERITLSKKAVPIADSVIAQLLT